MRRAFDWEIKKWDLSSSAKTKAQSLGEEQLGKLGEEENEPATERRRKYTDLVVDLGEREEQVTCHFSALALAMTDKACLEAKM